MSLKYLLDEHIPRAMKTELVRAEPALTVLNIGDAGAPSLGTLDPEILDWCDQHDFFLVTNNRGSMPRHLADHVASGRHVPGIFVVNMDMSVSATAEELILIAIASAEGEHRDVIQYLPIS